MNSTDQRQDETPSMDPRSDRWSRRQLLQAGLGGVGVSAAEQATKRKREPVPTFGTLAAMRITGLAVEIYETPVRAPGYQRWKIWTGKVPEFSGNHRMGLLRVFTDAGIEGLCPVRNLQSAQEIVSAVKPLVVGRDPLDREFIWHTLWKMERIYHFSIFTHSAIDIALWDIAAKAAGLPFYKLLGAYRDKIPAYRSSNLLLSSEAFVEDALQAKTAGYQAYKLHPRGDLESDLAACRAVREAVGDEMDLMLDPIGAYDHEESLKAARELEALGYLWLEEPMPEWDLRAYRELCRTVDIPICGPEVLPGSVYLTAQYIAEEAIDIVRSDVGLKGGITGVLKTAHLAEAFGKNIELHVSYSPFMNAAQAHIACAIENTLFVERIGTDELNTKWEKAYGVRDFFLKIDKEGYVHVPNQPGMGVEIERELLGKPVQVL